MAPPAAPRARALGFFAAVFTAFLAAILAAFSAAGLACAPASEAPGCPASGCPADGGGADGGDGGVGAADARPARDTSNVPLGLVAAYNFDEGNGSVVIDSSGNENNGGFVETMGWAQGQVGGDATFGGGYVELPPNMLDDARELTLAAWVRMGLNTAPWQRIFDFGHGTSGYFFLTTRTTTDSLRFAITRLGWMYEQILEVPNMAPPRGVWRHVAVVLNGAGGTMYVDGAPAAINPAVTLRPMDVGPFPIAWLGRSQFVADPRLDGELDQVRIYARALSASEIASLAGAP